MNREIVQEMRAEAEAIFRNALDAVDPYRAVKRFVRLDGNRLHLGAAEAPEVARDLSEYERIVLVGGGKASAPMARALESLLGERISRGVINVKYGFAEPLSRTELIEAGHPLPDEAGVKGAERILHLLHEAGEKDLVISLISGGGSALLPQPAGEIMLSEKQEVTRRLLECGASIDEINAVRKHISAIKGGQMARAAYPATVVNLMLSDVVGDKGDVIASGPFVPDSSTFESAWRIIEKYDLKNLPQAVSDHLAAGRQGQIPETPKAGDPIFARVHNFVVGSNILALEAAGKGASEMGYETLILSSMVEGETREVARVHCAIAKEIAKTGHPLRPPACIVSGGETTVTIRGTGLGGRNQEFCLAAAIDLQGMESEVVILSGGTDGNDGPTDAAGGVVDPLTFRRGEEQGLVPGDYLKANDAYHFLEQTKDLLLTGPTKTNVMDVRIVLVR